MIKRLRFATHAAGMKAGLAGDDRWPGAHVLVRRGWGGCESAGLANSELDASTRATSGPTIAAR